MDIKENKSIRILHLGLMVDNPRHGFSLSLEKIALGGYAELSTGTPNFQYQALQLAREFKPTLIFLQLQSENLISAQIAYDLSALAFCMEFSGDIRHDLPAHYITTGSSFHLSTFSNLRDVKKARAMGLNSEWLEIGVEPERYRTWEDPLPAPPIVAHFNDYDHRFELSEYRRQVVQRLRQEFGDQFGVYGNFPGANGNFNHDQVLESKNYAGAKIALNVSHFCVERYSSDRLGRITATGGALALSHAYPLIEEMYIPGEHIATFADLDEMCAKIRHYLSNEEERLRMVKAAQKHCLANYTFDCMAQNVVNLFLKYSNK